MLRFQSVTLRRGTRVLLQEVDLTIQTGEHWGIVGRNGSGKSSLLALVLGIRDATGLHADKGEVKLAANLAMAHVAQETPAVDRSAIDYVMDGDSELRALEQQLAACADDEASGELQASLFGELEAIDGYTAPARAARLMDGLGFSEAQLQTPVSDFSGGWRMRLNLAQALMCRSDILLLDEPTNHLDLDAVLWLQSWLQNYPGTVLLISHDRDFLDNCVAHIALLSEETLHAYTGNYSAYEKQHASRLEQQQAAHQKQQRTISHLHSYIDRFRAKATKAKQAQSRLKALAKLEEIAPAHVDSPFEFTFLPPKQIPNPLLKLTDAQLGYENKTLLNDISINLLPGDRIGLLGPNGAGKSTLIKALTGELPLLAGTHVPAQSLRIGYFAQHQLEQLQIDDTPLMHLQRLDKQASEQQLRNYLGGFGFVGDQVLDPVGPFSGGEKARLVLALLIYQRPNLLLLDEPTNHLDLEMRHALTLALQGFEGALLVVSHDRHLLRTVCDQFVLVANGSARIYDGDLDDYAQWLNEHRRGNTQEKVSTTSKTSGIDKRQLRQQEAARRQQLKPYLDHVRKSEKLLAELQQQLQDIEQKLTDSSLYEADNKDRLKELLAQQATLKQQLQQTENDWLEAAETLELAESSAV
ncbi:MAG: ATP-binding cassette domain-containing protein [Gammaproteobacteria bacterium]|nr:ATP-binding cassette domain-containing protein [Gammaproteobacteria bacterium]MCF6258768.1 ATP-binding cassette domain-containing protein [Gammaproteobacteria bacterium]